MSETVLTEQELDAVRRAREAADAMPLAANAIGDVYAIVRRLDAELTRLTKALPKTADGVTVVPGMTVWVVPFLNRVVETQPVPSAFDEEYAGVVRDGWYSTREAAARKDGE